ncbi:hypothetical protein E3J61_01445 [Candidatus Dependentiae bacterium]|nr:MAG: hypothetical protein E3J61_01445 [Candidatus Dependentiae bacterium]
MSYAKSIPLLVSTLILQSAYAAKLDGPTKAAKITWHTIQIVAGLTVAVGGGRYVFTEAKDLAAQGGSLFVILPASITLLHSGIKGLFYEIKLFDRAKKIAQFVKLKDR